MSANFKRIFNFALIDFYRNKGISVAAVFILTVTTLLFTGLFLVGGASSFLISNIENKIDITAYFYEDALEQDILNVRDQILKISPDIKNAQYVSKENALEEFKQKNESNKVFSKALAELGDNPFLPSLKITTSGSPSLYEQISETLQGDQFSDIIKKVDFAQKRETIEKIFSITMNVNKFGLIIGVSLILVAIVVVFNTMRLIIDRSKEEINTMRTVGASNWFVRGPFVIEGAIFGFVSFIICILITVLSIYLLSPGVSSLMSGFNLIDYFLANLWLIILIQLGSGVGLGVIFSFIAVRKYLS